MSNKVYVGIGMLALFLNFSAFAKEEGGWSGGGGNGLVCFDSKDITKAVRDNGHQVTDEQIGHITSIESVDLLEAKLPRGFPSVGNPPWGEDASTPIHLFNKLEHRFEGLLTPLSQLLGDAGTKIPGRNILKIRLGIPFSDDANLMIPFDSDKCTLVTIAKQFQTGSTVLLYLDDRLYSHSLHSQQSQNVIFLHELVYFKARERGQVDSRNTRILVAQMLQGDILVGPTMEMFRDLGFGEPDYMSTSVFRAWVFVRQALSKYLDGIKSGFDEENRTNLSENCQKVLGNNDDRCKGTTTMIEFYIRSMVNGWINNPGAIANHPQLAAYNQLIRWYLDYLRKREEQIKVRMKEDYQSGFPLDFYKRLVSRYYFDNAQEYGFRLVEKLTFSLVDQYAHLTRLYVGTAVMSTEGKVVNVDDIQVHPFLDSVVYGQTIFPFSSRHKFVTRVSMIGCSVMGWCHDSISSFEQRTDLPSDFLELSLTEETPGLPESLMVLKYTLHYDRIFELGPDTWKLGGPVHDAAKNVLIQ